MECCIIHNNDAIRFQARYQSIFKPKTKPFGIGCPRINAQSNDYPIEITCDYIVFLGSFSAGFLIQPNTAFCATVGPVHFFLNTTLIKVSHGCPFGELIKLFKEGCPFRFVAFFVVNLFFYM